jgi:hypothetical protein
MNEPTQPPGFLYAAELLATRNRNLGQLLLSERSTAYLTILLEMLRFRRNYESEPLHDDLFSEVREKFGAETEYTGDPFNQDIRQLLEWSLITDRIEKERLRGYKDTRRRKYRYRISDEAVAFLLWLEVRRRDDLEPHDTDTRDMLAELVGTLSETTRLFSKFASDTVDAESARRIFYLLSRMSGLTDNVSQALGDFNMRLLGFATQRYDVTTAKAILVELDRFLKQFLNRIHTLRTEIAPKISSLRHTRYTSRWQACEEKMQEESKATAHLMRIHLPAPEKTLASLADFYAPEGTLELLCARVSSAALQVWRKLYTHLRELERRSHRLEDLRARISEISQMEESATPINFIRALLAPATMVGDMHFWDETEKAVPPQPRWERHRVREEATLELHEKPRSKDAVPRSMDEERLNALKSWIALRGLAPLSTGELRLVSQGKFSSFDDFPRLIELARSGLLGQGARLAKAGLSLTPTDIPVRVEAELNALAFNDLSIAKKPLTGAREQTDRSNFLN